MRGEKWRKTAISWNFACHMSLAPRETAEKPWTPVIARVQSVYGNVLPNLAKPWEWLWDKSVQRVKDLLQLFGHFLLVIWCQIRDLPFVMVLNAHNSLEKMIQNVPNLLALLKKITVTSLFLYRYSLLVHMVSAASLAKCQIAVYPSLLATTTPNQVPSVTFILIDFVISICTVLLTSLSLPLS